MDGPTGFYDSHGIPIHIGDLIRTPHYRHRRGGRQMWLYFRVAKHPGGYEKPVVQNWDCLDANKWQCLLADAIADGSEVLQEARSHFQCDGDQVSFNDRPRKKGGCVMSQRSNEPTNCQSCGLVAYTVRCTSCGSDVCLSCVHDRTARLGVMLCQKCFDEIDRDAGKEGDE